LMLVNDSDLRDDLPEAIAAPIVERSDRLREQRYKAGNERQRVGRLSYLANGTGHRAALTHGVLLSAFCCGSGS
jgi:hypothetical protein